MGVWLKRHGVDAGDNRTWSKFTPEHLHMSETIPGMMNEGPPCFSPVALKARSSTKVGGLGASWPPPARVPRPMLCSRECMNRRARSHRLASSSTNIHQTQTHQHPCTKVVDIFKILYDLPSEDELVMQLQGLFWNFPPEHYPDGYVPTAPNGGYYHWSSMWMHSDRGRSTVWPPKLQCTLVLEDVSLYDHGFVFLSKRHVSCDV